MARYQVEVKGNRVTGVQPLEEDEEEYLGIEWALSEAKDSHRHNGCVDGAYTLDGEEELQEFLDFLGKLLGREALGAFGRA
jgi:hypothetical protein